jgi:hypothetical protein
MIPSTHIRYFIIVASKEHVKRGIKSIPSQNIKIYTTFNNNEGIQGGFAQACHGKKAPLAKINVGDWILYYSPTYLY